MQFRVLSRDPLDDGWTEPPAPLSVSGAPPCGTLRPGDVVLYKVAGQRTPAVLVESAGEGCWLAHDARHAQGLLYLDAESIAVRLPRMELLGEAA